MFIATRNKTRDYIMPGFATLFRNLIVTMREAEINNSSYKIYWNRKKVTQELPRSGSNNIDDFILPDFNTLFKNDIAIDNIPKNSIEVYDWKLKIFDEDDLCGLNKNLVFQLINACMYEGGKYNIQTKYPNYTHMIPKNIKEKYCNCINKLIPSDEVSNIVNNIYKNFDNNTISLIIRSWPEDKNRQKLFDFNIYIKYIKNNHSNKSIFFSTDDVKYLNILKSKINNKIIYYNNTKTYKDIYQTTLVILYLMSKTKEIIGSRYSNFPEFGWWMSNCESKLVLF